jgi:hypothetical protein
MILKISNLGDDEAGFSNIFWQRMEQKIRSLPHNMGKPAEGMKALKAL